MTSGGRPDNSGICVRHMVTTQIVKVGRGAAGPEHATTVGQISTLGTWVIWV